MSYYWTLFGIGWVGGWVVFYLEGGEEVGEELGFEDGGEIGRGHMFSEDWEGLLGEERGWVAEFE